MVRDRLGGIEVLHALENSLIPSIAAVATQNAKRKTQNI